VVQSACPISLEAAGGREGRLIAVARESIFGSSCPESGEVSVVIKLRPGTYRSF